MFKILIGVVIAAFIVIVAFMVIDPKVNQETVYNTISTNSTSTYSLTIEGEVAKPGTYVLEEGAIMQDLVDTAGGLTSNGDVRCYFESATLVAKSTYYIAPIYNEGDVCNTDPIAKVNINSDDSETLMSINGISSSIASSIISYRSENGDFMTIESLLDVYGIGNATYKKIRNYVILHE